jgi:hypothetical protein
MRTSFSVVAALAVVACSSSKAADQAPVAEKPAEPPPAIAPAAPAAPAAPPTRAPAIDEKEAIAYLRSWFAQFAKRGFAADAVLGAAFVNVKPVCGNGELDEAPSQPCVGGRLHEIMATHPTLSFEKRERAALDAYNDETGKLATLPGVVYFDVAVRDRVQRANMEYIEIMVALGADDNGTLVIRGIEVESGYGTDTGD